MYTSKQKSGNTCQDKRLRDVEKMELHSTASVHWHLEQCAAVCTILEMLNYLCRKTTTNSQISSLFKILVFLLTLSQKSCFKALSKNNPVGSKTYRCRVGCPQVAVYQMLCFDFIDTCSIPQLMEKVGMMCTFALSEPDFLLIWWGVCYKPALLTLAQLGVWLVFILTLSGCICAVCKLLTAPINFFSLTL